MRQRFLPLCLLLGALLVVVGASAVVAGQDVVLLEESASRCMIFQALSPAVPADCAPPRTRGLPVRPSLLASTPRRYAFATKIYFTFDSSTIMPASYPLLDTLAGVLKDPAMDGQVMQIIGHTDSRGAVSYNQRLSAQRAWAVQQYLHETHRIALTRLPVLGRGEQQLYDPAHPDAAVNRRVEFVNLSASDARR